MKTIKLLAVVDTNGMVYGSDQEAKWTIDGAVKQASMNLADQLGINLEVAKYEFSDISAWWYTPGDYGYLWRNHEPSAHVLVVFTNRKTIEPDGAYSVMNSPAQLCDETRPVIVQELQNDALDSLTLAHAIGHTLGMSHDPDRGWQMTAAYRESDYFSPRSVADAAWADTGCLTPPSPPNVPTGTPGGGGGCMGWELLALLLLVALGGQSYRAEKWRVKHHRAMARVHTAAGELNEMADTLTPDEYYEWEEADERARRGSTP